MYALYYWFSISNVDLRNISKTGKPSQPNIDVVHVKVAALIKLERFSDAISALDKADPNLQKELLFAKAYSLYRLNNFDECMAVIERSKVIDGLDKEAFRFLELQLVNICDIS